MSRWISIPNGTKREGMMAINLDHVITFYDIGAITYAGDTEPTARVNVILSDGGKRVFDMTARDFAFIISRRGETIQILEEVTA